MAIAHLKLTVPSDTCQLICIGDPHYGCESQRRRPILKAIEYVEKTENAYIVTIGDNQDITTAQSYGVLGHSPSLQEAVGLFASDFRNVAGMGKLIGSVQGNHDKRLAKHTSTDYDPTETLFNEWNATLGTNIQYGKPILIVSVRVQRDNGSQYDSFHCVFSHGSGGGGTAGTVANNSIKMRNQCIDADLYVQGHFHRPLIVYENIMQINASGGLTPKEQCFVTLGGNVVDASYAQEKRLASAPNLNAVITLKGRSHSRQKKRMIVDWLRPEDL